MKRVVAVMVVAAAGGCSDLSQRWELDHARVLAVRLSPPGLSAGERAAVDVLVGNDAGEPAVIAASAVAVAASDADLGQAITVAVVDGGWVVIAGDAAALAAAGATAAQPLDVDLTLDVTVDGHLLTALKSVRLGAAAANPAVPAIEVEGAAAGATIDLAIGDELALGLSGLGGGDDLIFDWFTSTGTLRRSETATATLEIAAADPASGHVVAVVRSPDGGVAWTSAAVTAN